MFVCMSVSVGVSVCKYPDDGNFQTFIWGSNFQITFFLVGGGVVLSMGHKNRNESIMIIINTDVGVSVITYCYNLPKNA